MLFEPHNDQRRPSHSRAFERWTGLAFFVGTLGFVMIVLYVLDR